MTSQKKKKNAVRTLQKAVQNTEALQEEIAARDAKLLEQRQQLTRMEIELAQSNHVKERSQTKMSSMGEESQVVLHHRPLVALIHSAQVCRLGWCGRALYSVVAVVIVIVVVVVAVAVARLIVLDSSCCGLFVRCLFPESQVVQGP